MLRLLRSTAFRLSLVYLVVFAAFAAALLAFIGWQSRVIYEDQIVATLEAEVRGLAERYQLDGIRGLVESVEARSGEPGAGIYILTTFSGERVAGNIGLLPNQALETPGIYRVPYVSAAAPTAQLGEDISDTERAAIVQIFHLPGGFRLAVGRDIEDEVDFQSVLWRASLFAAGLVMLLGVGGGYYISRRILHRIDEMNATARKIMAGDLSERISRDATGDEFDRLAESLNLMLERIGELMGGLQEVSENIAHDLKTPLTRIRSQAEEALRLAPGEGVQHAALEATIVEADRLIAIFNALLQIARVEAGTGADDFAEVDLSEIARDIADLFAPAAEEGALDLEVSAPEPVRISGDRALMGQAVSNLLDNAMTHAVPAESETRSSVSVNVRRVDKDAEVVVADRGPGIPKEQRRHVLDRFVRLETSRSRPGSGLGLSLVSAIVHLHRGRMSLEDNAPGLRVVIRLPLA